MAIPQMFGALYKIDKHHHHPIMFPHKWTTHSPKSERPCKNIFLYSWAVFHTGFDCSDTHKDYLALVTHLTVRWGSTQWDGTLLSWRWSASSSFHQIQDTWSKGQANTDLSNSFHSYIVQWGHSSIVIVQWGHHSIVTVQWGHSSIVIVGR